MALFTFLLVIAAFIWLSNVGKRAKREEQFKKLSAKQKAAAATAHRRRQKEIDEQITVILPTIRNDK